MTDLSLKYIVGWAYEYLRKYLSHMILILSLVLIILNLYQVNYIQRIIDATLQKQWIFVYHTIFGFIFINLFKMLSIYLFGYFSSRLESEVCCDIRGRLVRKLFATQLQEIESFSMGQLLNR